MIYVVRDGKHVMAFDTIENAMETVRNTYSQICKVEFKETEKVNGYRTWRGFATILTELSATITELDIKTEPDHL